MKIGDRVKIKIYKVSECDYVYYEGVLLCVYITPKTNLWDIQLDDGNVLRAIEEENIEVIENGENN